MKKVSTKELIISTLRELMAKKEYDEITVSDIIEHTGIARSTFYRHFHDKENVLELVFEEVVLEGNVFDFTRSIEERETDMLRIMMQNPVFWTYLHNNPSFNKLWRKNAVKGTLDYIRQQYPEQNVPDFDFFCLILGAGFVMLNHDVLTGDLNMKPEEMGKRFQAIIDTYLNHSKRQ